MTKGKQHGRCHICGKVGGLSLEHVPPKQAYNTERVTAYRYPQIMKWAADPGSMRGTVLQRGAGAYTLCERCNSRTGHWYGGALVSWCQQARELLSKSAGRASILYPYYLHPLRVLKQVVTMFFSVCNDHFADTAPDLVRFVLNRDAMYLPPMYRFFMYYNTSSNLRRVGVSAEANVLTRRTIVSSEFNFPPFGYVMTIDSRKPDDRLGEITYFSRYQYDECKVLYVTLPSLPTDTPYPGDYRHLQDIIPDG